MEIYKMFDSPNDAPTGDSSPVVAVAVTDKLNDKVLALIVILTGQDGVFTAFDITKQLRTENPTLNVPHADVREMVLEEYNNTFCDDYAKECIDLTVGRAFVYFPDHMSALDHPLAIQPASVPDSTVASTVTSTDTDLTVEKRLNIPIAILDKLGLVPGKLVRIDTDSGVMSLTEVTAAPTETLHVNADGRLRLNARTLTNAFGRLPDKYDISISSCRSKIEITPK
jgi:hypothetical protein